MKTSKKRTFPRLDNEFLVNLLGQLVKQHLVIQMFFTKDRHSVFSHLIIHVDSNSDATQMQQKKWVKKVRTLYQIEVHFICSQKLRHRFSMGHPFMECCCRPSALCYQKEEATELPTLARKWKHYKKKFTGFQERFYHDHDLHRSHIQDLLSEGASNSVFTSYARLIGYDLEYLEELYSGNHFHSLDLDERINRLIEYIPEIQKHFVKNSPSTYYLTGLFAKAKEATANDDTLFNSEMYEAVEIAEQALYRLVERRFAELKRRLKKEALQLQKVPDQLEGKPKDVVLERAVEIVLDAVEVEQVYLYHQMAYGSKTTYYLLLIATGAGNEKVSQITQSLRSSIGERYDFVLIGHSRCWIQENLYQHQHFFANVMQEHYLVYSSSPYHPELHWEVPHNPYHADLYLHYKSTKESALQFFEIVNSPKGNYQGLDYLFSLFFLSFCRTYIFVKTYYLPNYLSSQALWQLCLYADTDLYKYHYLMEQFWTDFFAYLDKHRALSHKVARLNKQEVGQMNTIVQKLMDELHHLVVEDASNFEKDEIGE